MSAEENRDTLPPEENRSTADEPEQKPPEGEPEAAKTPDSTSPAESMQHLSGEGADEQLTEASAVAPVAGERETDAAETARIARPRGFFAERSPEIVEVPSRTLRNWTRRDLLIFGVGAAAALAGAGFLLPQETLFRMGIRSGMDSPGKERFLNQALRFDDDVAKFLYSQDRLVPTYSKSEITPLKNNYNGATPGPGYIPGWRLTLEGLASGLSVSLDIAGLLARFQLHEQITRLVCVEGWSAIAWWAGLKFDDLLRAYPPAPQAKWASVDSSVNLDADGNPDPYYASLDLATARHPQTLLATHFNGQPLTVEHGAPLRLLAPVKLGLKNVKAVTRIRYSAEEPPDYWADRGYSRYDGI